MRGKIVQRRIIERNVDGYGIEHVLYELLRSDGAIFQRWDFAPCPACQGRGKVSPLAYLQETSGIKMEHDRVCTICGGSRYYFKSESSSERRRDDEYQSQD